MALKSSPAICRARHDHRARAPRLPGSLRKLIDCFSALDEARFPVVCAIQGGCIGGALDLATACDIRLCSADAFFTVQEISIGMAADLGVLQRLPKIVPPASRARWPTPASVSAPSARWRSAWSTPCLPDAAALLGRALALAQTIAAKSPLAIAGSKLALNHARDHSTASALQQMTLLQSAIFDTAEMATAIAAWKEKRGAEFADLAASRRSARAGAGDAVGACAAAGSSGSRRPRPRRSRASRRRAPVQRHRFCTCAPASAPAPAGR